MIQNATPSEDGEIRAFDHSTSTRLVFGVNAVDRVGVFANELGLEKALVVTDAGIVAAGHLARVQKALEAEGIEATVFDRVIENPDTACVDDCLAVANLAQVDGIIGLGGGSSLDTAKGCNFLLTNGGRMQDYWGVGKAARPMLPLIAIPTTAGTGSETQSFALISDAETHRKMACGDPKAAARIAVLDPAWTVSQPERVTACTGIDAVAHAVESAVTKSRNPLSSMYAREAFKLAAVGFPEVMRHPHHFEARGRMMLAASFAGMAIESSMLGSAHAAANPLTARFGVVHGHAVGMMLPAIVRHNSAEPEIRAIYSDLAQTAGLTRSGRDDGHEALIAFLESLLELGKAPRGLTEAGIDSESIGALAADAAEQWTANFNPRPMAAEDFEAVYRARLL